MKEIDLQAFANRMRTIATEKGHDMTLERCNPSSLEIIMRCPCGVKWTACGTDSATLNFFTDLPEKCSNTCGRENDGTICGLQRGHSGKCEE